MASSRLRGSPRGLALVLAALVGAGGSAGVIVSAQDRANEVERVSDLADVIVDDDGSAENFLLVGSDSRAGIDESSTNVGATGTEADFEGAGLRSDTIMILRREGGGGAALLSIPRDLWVEIAETGDENKINAAYNGGPRRLAATITSALGIPIHHYVEIDFVGFERLVDEIGGVEICFAHPARDRHSGLDEQPGCHVLDGVRALAYARSRHYQEFIGAEWTEVGGVADLGRIQRQQHFISAAVTGVLQQLEANPFRLNELISAGASAVRIDQDADPVRAANALRAAAGAGLSTFQLPVEFIEIGDVSALELGDGADSILDYFRGVGPPPPTTTTVPAADSTTD